ELAFREASLDPESELYSVVYNSDDKKKKASSDFYTYFRPVLILSKRAYDELIFLQDLPCLRISSPRTDDVAIFVSTVLKNAFDYEKSDYDKGPNGYVVYKPVLKLSADCTEAIFRIAESPQSLFVNQLFKDSVESKGLKGLKFREVECGI
ncbi:imm11 family protein, partial [Pseudomonas agarici]